MSSLNVVAFVGHAGAEPEVRYFESGSCKVSVNLAVEEFVSGEKRKHWIPLVAWGKRGEILASYVPKGKQIAIQGSLKEDTWEEKDGKKCKRIYVLVDRLQLLGGGNKTESTAQETAAAEEVF